MEFERQDSEGESQPLERIKHFKRVSCTLGEEGTQGAGRPLHGVRRALLPVSGVMIR
jgi:hypothetical protein